MRPLVRNRIIVGDARTRLARLPSSVVDCVITSPPYFQLRNYHEPGQLGLEPTVHAWVDNLRAVMTEVARVLKPTGSLWLNLGDSYSRHDRYGAPPKGQLLAPERILLALADDGWIVRNKVIWAKTNPMPLSVADRLNTTYEVVYFLVRSRRYYFDLDIIREPHRDTDAQSARRYNRAKRPDWIGPLADANRGLVKSRGAGSLGHKLGKNPGYVWRLSTRGYRGAHFATFPTALIERPLLATCPERLCTACGTPWRRHAHIRRTIDRRPKQRRDDYVLRYATNYRTIRTLGPLRAACGCDADYEPGLVLDPFFGTGTVGVVAQAHDRDWLGIELSKEYVAMAWQRLRAAATESKAAA